MSNQPNVVARWSIKFLKAIILGVSCFFIGILLAILSPVIAAISLLHKPKPRPGLAEKWEKGLKSFENKIREAQDPDYKEPWKQDHLDLYGDIKVDEPDGSQ